MLSDVSHFWYLNMSSFVKWGRDKSQPFPVPLGIKQGGINSPDFFAVYFDKITEILRQKGIGCHIHKLFLAIILFADDICLLAPTRSSLEKMIGLVSDYCSVVLNSIPRNQKSWSFLNPMLICHLFLLSIWQVDQSSIHVQLST